jgi:hypothetical protein
MMFRVCAALLLAGAALATPVADPTHGGHGKDRDYVQCHVVYDVVHDNHCETYHEEVCHEEYDVVVDTTYIEECADTVTQHCQSHDQQVHHSSAVVGHDSQLIVGGHAAGYAKRDAEAEPGYGYAPHNNLQCFSKPHKQCHQRPVQNQRQVCHEEYDTIVDTTYIEECQDIVTKHCNSVSKQVHHSSAVVGHDTQVVAHGHHGKREAEADAEAGHHGYSTGPQCQEHVERQCHKVPQQHERKVARPVCQTVVDTTYVEECQNTFTTECSQTHTQVHHSAAVVGHDTHVVAHGHGYGKRSAEPAGYGSAPVCKEHVERQCHQVPQHVERKVPRPVCHSEPRQQCHQSAHKVPRRVCAQYYDDKKNNKDNRKNRGYGYGRY